MPIANPLERVRDLDVFETRVQCPKCGRSTTLELSKLRISDRTRLTELLAALECNETRSFRKCGGRPKALEIVYRPPPGLHDPSPEPRIFVMDQQGTWHDPANDSTGTVLDPGHRLREAYGATRLEDLGKGRYVAITWDCCGVHDRIGPAQAAERKITTDTLLIDLWKHMPCPKCGLRSPRVNIRVYHR
jgi:hypothetical protein